MVIWVREKELPMFLPFIPADMQGEVRNGNWLCLGALTETGDDQYDAAGVLLFAPEEGSYNGEDRSIMIVMHWLYVAEKHRRKGLANELMEALSDTLEDNPAEGIICDVPFDSEYDLAEAFFVSWGFRFEVIDCNELIITKDECRRIMGSADTTDKPKGMVSVWDIPEDIFRKTLDTVKKIEKTGYYYSIQDSREDYLGDISLACRHGDEISAISLFIRESYGVIRMVILADLDPTGTKELPKLIRHSAAAFCLDYPDEAKVRITLGTGRSRKLAEYLLPDTDPVQIRRGIFY